MDLPYNSYSRYIKETFNERVQKITINAGFTCPNRDGSKGVGGCTYCNNDSFTHYTDIIPIKDQINKSIENYSKKKIKKYFVYFQSFSNTYAPLKHLEKLYLEALDHPQVIGINIGTRSDCIDEEKLSFLEQLSKDYHVTLEYGLESSLDSTLKRINRGHDIDNYLRAMDMTKDRGIKICTHLIFGFPWESKEFLVESADFISKLPIDFLKIHQLHIVKNTVLGNEYLKSPFDMITKEEYMEVLTQFIERVRPDIIFERFFGHTPFEILLSPSWPEGLGQLNQELIERLNGFQITQGSGYKQ